MAHPKAEERKINRGSRTAQRLSKRVTRNWPRPRPASEVLPSVVHQEALKRRRGKDVSAGSGKEAGIHFHHRAIGKKRQYEFARGPAYSVRDREFSD